MSAGATSRFSRTYRMTSRRTVGRSPGSSTKTSYIVREGWTASERSPSVAWPCGSMSTSKTLRCSRARKAERLMDVMVFPHPPFWFTTAIVRITHSSRRWCAFPDGPTVAKYPTILQQFVGVSTDGTPTGGAHYGWLLPDEREV